MSLSAISTLKTNFHRSFSHLTRATVVLIALCLLFGYGVGVGAYRWPPFLFLRNVRSHLPKVNRLPETSRNYDQNTVLLRLAFTEPLIQGDQIYPPIDSLEDMYKANKSLVLRVQDFYDAYDHLTIMDAAPVVLDQGATKLLKVSYALAGRQYDAYAYSLEPLQRARGAALVIPGSGRNQSSEIYKKDPSNYHHGLIEVLENSLYTFILVKPNEDSLAFHHNRAKLNESSYINWLLDHGASYSALYIAHSLAITKYLRSRHKKLVVVGLSQGGRAALLNSLQSRPDAAIVASGYSVLLEKIRVAAHDQIIIPGLQEKLSVDAVRDRIRQSPTQFLLTYGRQGEGIYKVEAEERHTCKTLSQLRNVDCQIHDGGHIFPQDLIKTFLSNHLSGRHAWRAD